MFDPKLLPYRALIDTGVMFRALGDRPNDPQSPVARAFFDAMRTGSRRMLLAAPAYAEVLRGTKPSQLPRGPHVVVVNFDQSAAEILATRFPHAAVKVLAKQNGINREYYLYDALIIACGLRYKAECVVAYDRRELTAMADHVGLRVRSPEDFLAEQGHLPMHVPMSKAPERTLEALQASAAEDSSEDSETVA